MRGKLQKILAVILSTVSLFCYACGNGGGSESSSEGGSEYSSSESESSSVNEEVKDVTPYECKTVRKYDIPDMKNADAACREDIFILDGAPALLSGTYRLAFDTDGVRIDDVLVCGKENVGTDDSLIAYAYSPAKVRVTIDGFKSDEIFQGNYSEFYSSEGDVVAVATVKSDKGSVFKVYDFYGIVDGGFSVKRIVKVEDVKERAGYAAAFEMTLCDCENAEYFVPTRIYGSSTVITDDVDYSVSYSRLPTPLTMVRDVSTGQTLSVNVPDPNIRTTADDPLTTIGVSSEYLYGSLGLTRSGVSCTYPCIESGQEANARKYAALNVDNDISYGFTIRAEQSDDYGDAMVKSLSKAVAEMKDIDYQADLDEIYKTCIEDMSSLTVYRDTAYVLPFASYVKDGSVIAYVAQSGYIGMQISCGYEMLRYGIYTGDAEIYANGYNIVNMWATTAVPEDSDSGVFYCYNNGKGYGDTAPTLRQLSDGAEGMLDALILMESERPSVNIDAWWDLVYGYAEFLVKAQNSDGSWYRAYDYDGNMLKKDNEWHISVDDNTLADKKYSTQIPIRFLTRMYEYTEDERYLATAEKAGEYVKKYVIDVREYRGGTLDQKGNYDREAGIYAFYAMSALYGVTGDKTWLDYAEKAGAYALSFTYMHDFVVYNDSSNIAGKALESGCTAGLSPIVIRETGMSSVDPFSGYMYYECFKMYLWTGNEYYLKQALVLQNCQKRTMDLKGELGYYKKSFMCEATAVMTFKFATAEGGVWLPWITNANIEPMTNMLRTFGEYDVKKLLDEYSTSELLEKLSDYGSGGKI